MDNGKVKRLRIKVMVRVVVWGLIVTAVLMWWIGTRKRKALGSLVREAIRYNEILVMSDITWFEWDRMYIYPPYTPVNQMVCQELVDHSRTTGMTKDVGYVSEGNCHLAFMSKRKVVYHADLSRLYADFSTLNKEGGYTPDEARFRVINGHQLVPMLEERHPADPMSDRAGD